jgi:putative DNA primase/helicase
LEENKQITGSIRDEALYYVSIGLPIIPICSPKHQGMAEVHRAKCHSWGKAPILPDWTSRTATSKEEIISWFQDAKKTGANINIGIPLGVQSGIIGIDIDGREGEVVLLALSNNDLPPTWEFTTGSGRRILYKLPTGITTKEFRMTGQNKHEEFAILGTGRQTVVPPSVHNNGLVYRWKTNRSPRDLPLADCPLWVLEKIDATKINDETATEVVTSKVMEEDWHRILHEGERNVGVTRLIGSCFAKGNTKEQTLIAAQAYNRNFCDPPLTNEDVAIIVDSIEMREKGNKSKQDRNLTEKPKKPILRPTAFIKHFILRQQEQGYVWKYSAEMGTFFRCDENVGPWQLLDIDYVKSYLRKMLIDIKQGGTITWDSQKNTNECIEAMKAELVTPGEADLFDLGYSIQNNTWEHNPLDIICLKNGVYNWRQKALLPWTSKVYTTLKLPVEYKPNDLCPYWEKSLREWLPNEDTIKFLQEFVGLCLIPDTSYRTAVFLYGTGSNGKSMFLDTIRTIFGEGLVSIPLHRLAERFETAYLQNKLINICGDIDSKYITETGIVKSIISGDVIHAELKHGKAYDFIPVVRLLFSANNLPPVADKSHAWYTRWKYIKFPHTFPVNPTYKLQCMKILESEKSGILNWALEGLIRLKANNEWTDSEDMKRSEVEYKSENDNVAAFLEDYVTAVEYTGNSEDVIPTGVLYKCYEDWIEINLSGVKRVSLKEFSKRVQTYGYEKSVRYVKGKSSNVFLGMLPKEEYRQDYEGYKVIAG